MIGGGMHASVLADIISTLPNVQLCGYVDKIKTKIPGKFIEEEHEARYVNDKKIKYFIVAVGDNNLRRRLFEKEVSAGLTPYTIISPHAYISKRANIGRGCVIMPHVAIQTNAKIYDNCIINTGALIEHDCVIKNNVHISPGATLSGCVQVGENSLIGNGASIRDKIIIGDNCVVGTGSVVINNIQSNEVWVGNPAKRVR